MTTLPVGTWADERAAEYRVKAAFLYNFARLVEWPAEKMPTPETPVVIGVLGKDPFGPMLDAIAEKPVDRHPVQIRRFEGFRKATESHPRIAEIRRCHMLFVASDQQPFVPRIVDQLKFEAVLTVGEHPGFIDCGGMINFVLIEGKTRFEINLRSAKQANIVIRSRLSRLASRVIKE